MAINPKILEAVNQANAAVAAPAMVRTQGAGHAYQLAAQSSAIAVQDSADFLRSVEMIVAAALGVLAVDMLKNKQAYPTVTAALTAMLAMGVTNFGAVGSAAAAVASEFPSS